MKKLIILLFAMVLVVCDGGQLTYTFSGCAEGWKEAQGWNATDGNWVIMGQWYLPNHGYTHTYTWNSPANITKIRINYCSADGQAVADGGSYTLNCDCSVPSVVHWTNKTSTVCITNDWNDGKNLLGLKAQAYYCIDGGAPVPYGDPVWIPDGKWQCFTMNTTSTNGTGNLTCFTVMYWDEENLRTKDGTINTTDGTDPGSSGGSSNPGGTDRNPETDTYPSGTNSNVNDQAIFDALRNLLHGVSKEAKQDVQITQTSKMQNTLEGMSNRLASAGSPSFTNNITITNTPNADTNSARENTQKGMSNLLAQLTATNNSGLDTSTAASRGLSWLGAAGLPSSFAGAQSMVSGHPGLAAVSATMDGMGSAIPSPSSVTFATNAGGPKQFNIGIHSSDAAAQSVLASVPAMTIKIVDSPYFSSLFLIMNRLWKYILYFGYAIKIVKELQAIYKLAVASRGIGISNAEFQAAGFGGNLAGWTITALIVVGTLAFYAFLLAALVGNLTGELNWTTMMTAINDNPVDDLPWEAKHLVLAAFPLRLAMALLLAYITYRWTAWKVAVGATIAAKFLVHQ